MAWKSLVQTARETKAQAAPASLAISRFVLAYKLATPAKPKPSVCTGVQTCYASGGNASLYDSTNQYKPTDVETDYEYKNKSVISEQLICSFISAKPEPMAMHKQ